MHGAEDIIINDEISYEHALGELQALVEVDPPAESEAGRRLLALADALEAYELVHYPLFAPAPEEVDHEK